MIVLWTDIIGLLIFKRIAQILYNGCKIMDIAQVIRLLKAKDEQGLSYLYDNYAEALNGIIYRIVGSQKLSEEILQQTFLKVWEKINSYDSKKSTLFTWMSRIARNNAIDMKRLKAYENNQKTDSIDSEYDLALIAVNVSAKLDVEILLKDLDAKHKAVLDCVYLQGYSHREAAKKLDIPLVL